MKDNGFPNNDNIIRLIGKKWVLLILKEIKKKEEIRFNQFKQVVEITSATLSSILKDLEHNHIIQKTYSEFYSSEAYSLTEKGKKIIDFIKPLESLQSSSDIDNYKILMKSLLSLAIEKKLLEIGNHEFEEILNRLKVDERSLADCYDDQELLKRVLYDLFGKSYERVDVITIAPKTLEDCQGIVIDDDPDVVDSISNILENKGVCIVGKGYNGEEAFQMFKKLRPKFVILDMKMPEYDGAYAIKKIKNEDSNAKIIVLTAYTEYTFDKNEVTAVFTKPFNIDEVISLIQNTIC